MSDSSQFLNSSLSVSKVFIAYPRFYKMLFLHLLAYSRTKNRAISGFYLKCLLNYKSRGSRPPISMPIFSMIHQKNRKSKLHLGYKCGFSFTNLAFRIQKQHFVYKYLVVVYKNCVSIYKLAALLTIEFIEFLNDIPQ